MTPLAGPGSILAVVGMTREAKILGPDAPVLIGGGDADALAATLEAELSAGLVGVVSFGLCGSLDPSIWVPVGGWYVMMRRTRRTTTYRRRV